MTTRLSTKRHKKVESIAHASVKTVWPYDHQVNSDGRLSTSSWKKFPCRKPASIGGSNECWKNGDSCVIRSKGGHKLIYFDSLMISFYNKKRFSVFFHILKKLCQVEI